MAMMKTVEQHAQGTERERFLLSRIADQDSDALDSLYRIYHPKLFKFVFRLTRSYGAAEELVNDIMMVVWRSAAKFRGDSKVSTWIFGIAYRQAMRRVAKKKLKLVPFSEAENVADDRPVNFEQQDWVRHGLSELPEAQQITVILVFYVGLSYDEAAKVTDCPVNTVKTRMFHAKRKLKTLLEASAVTRNGHLP